MSMQNNYRRCLDKLAGASPKRKAALIRSLLPGMEAALNSGQSLKEIWEALGTEGLLMSYRVFHITVSRARKARKPTAASNWGKQDKPSESQGMEEAKADTVGERDPLANLRRLEEDRPGFHWRGTQSVKASLQATEDSNGKSKR
jgi:hypothetical protein